MTAIQRTGETKVLHKRNHNTKLVMSRDLFFAGNYPFSNPVEIPCPLYSLFLTCSQRIINVIICHKETSVLYFFFEGWKLKTASENDLFTLVQGKIALIFLAALLQ